MNECPNCKAVINPKWAGCLACGFPIDKRPAIKADGGPSFPVEVKMQSAILGAAADVMLWPDRATVDGCEYSNQELVDLLSRGLSAADLLAVHDVKRSFEGQVCDDGLEI